MVMPRLVRSADLWQQQVKAGVDLYEKTKAMSQDPTVQPGTLAMQGWTYLFQVIDGYEKMVDIWLGSSGPGRGMAGYMPGGATPAVNLVVDDSNADAVAEAIPTNLGAGTELAFTLYDLSGTLNPIPGKAVVTPAGLVVSVPGLEAVAKVPKGTEQHWLGVVYTPPSSGVGTALANVHLIRVPTA